MIYKRGAIYLANLNPSRGTEPGKTRPCVVIQNDLLSSAGHPSTTILPITSRLIKAADPLRFDISARDSLHRDSQVLIDQARTIDNRRLTGGELTVLSDTELTTIEEYLKQCLGFAF